MLFSYKLTICEHSIRVGGGAVAEIVGKGRFTCEGFKPEPRSEDGASGCPARAERGPLSIVTGVRPA